jgi:structural protein KPP10_ORF10
MGAYSFLNIVGSINGPGANIAIGAGTGAAKEGISTAYEEEKTTTQTGADGAIAHSLHAGQTGTITIRLLKTSPYNAQLSSMYNFQRQPGGSNWGQNNITFRDIVRGDVIDGRQMAITKWPDMSWAEDAGTVDWTFRGILNESLGPGQNDIALP